MYQKITNIYATSLDYDSIAKSTKEHMELNSLDRKVLKDNGKISAELAKIHAESEFESEVIECQN